MSRRQTARGVACATTLIMLAGCAGDSPAVSDFCVLYEPVYVSQDDTAETVRQAMRNNAVWQALCDADPA